MAKGDDLDVQVIGSQGKHRIRGTTSRRQCGCTGQDHSARHTAKMHKAASVVRWALGSPK